MNTPSFTSLFSPLTTLLIAFRFGLFLAKGATHAKDAKEIRSLLTNHLSVAALFNFIQ
jgi:hypothetical protein